MSVSRAARGESRHRLVEQGHRERSPVGMTLGERKPVLDQDRAEVIKEQDNLVYVYVCMYVHI